MNIGIYSNQNYLGRNSSTISRIQTRFKQAGFECSTVGDVSGLEGLDVLFVLGGDGTILTVAAECAVRGIKIIGINYGHIGFLTEYEAEKADEAVELVIGGKYKIMTRSLLEVDFGEKVLALNDFVVQRNTGGARYNNTVEIRAEIDGSTVDNFSADGIIVGTPTGSTAYSLSAGGSVLTPDIKAFTLTPICAHSLHSRPIVFSDSSEITLTHENFREPLVMSVDGRVVGKLPAGERVKIKKSERSAMFITKGEEDFFKKLLIKLSIWSK